MQKGHTFQCEGFTMSHTIWNNLEEDILFLLKFGDVWGLTIYELMEELEIPKTTLINALQRLIDAGVVKRTRSRGLDAFGYLARGRPTTYFKLTKLEKV